ncbi:MAG TPA: hypothetical protein VFZ93_00690 [Albitalea sp.]
MGTPFSRLPTMLEPVRHLHRQVDRFVPAAAAELPAWSDPRSLVDRAFALLASEAQAWELRPEAEPPSGEPR